MATISSPRPQSPAGSTRMIQSPQIPQSPSYTPTSSVRASLDLPPPTDRSSSPGPNQTQRPRNRAALRDYYNLRSKPPSTTGSTQPLSRTASISSTTSTATITSTALPQDDTTTLLPSALDDPAFQPEPYISSLLASSNLKTVLKVEATLISEIKNLDGERKALVYDNYSKLIKATRTIGGMRRSVDGNGDRDRLMGHTGRPGSERQNGGGAVGSKGIGALEAAVDGVARMAEELGGGVGGREEVDRRRDVKRKREQRETVKWVSDGPERLRRLVGEGKVEEAEAQWKVISGVLDKWGTVKGVEGMRKAYQEAMQIARGEQNGTQD